MLATFSAPGGGRCEMLPSSLLRWCFLSIFSHPGPMGYPILGPHLSSIFEVFGLILASCWGQLGAILDHLSISASTGWATLLIVALVFSFDFSAIQIPSWRYFGCILRPSSVFGFGGFLIRDGSKLAPFYRLNVPRWLHLGSIIT